MNIIINIIINIITKITIKLGCEQNECIDCRMMGYGWRRKVGGWRIKVGGWRRR